MKKNYTFFTIFFAIPTIIFAQNASNDLWNGTKDSKGLIWVVDSSYTYDWNETQYDYNFNSQVLKRDERGNATVTLLTGIHYQTKTKEIISQSEYEYDQNNNMTISRYMEWNLTKEIWDTSYVTTYTYDANGNNIYAEYQRSNPFRNFMTYDQNNNQTSVHRQNWNNDQKIWVNANMVTTTYDENDYKSSQLYQTWDVTNSFWVNTSQTISEFDAPTGIRTYELRKMWDNDLNDWVNQSKTNRVIDNNNVTSTSQNWDTDLKDWVNNSQYIALYETLPNKKISSLGYKWDTDLNNWANASYTTYDYDANDNLILNLLQIWNVGLKTWINNSKSTYEFNSNNDRTLWQVEKWDTISNKWYGNNKNLVTYDENNNRIESKTFGWDTNLNDWKPIQKFVNYWSQLEVANINNVVFNQIFAYPNPTNGIIKLEFNDKKVKQISVFDVSGKPIVEKRGIDHNVEIDLSNYLNGIYVIGILTDEEFQVLKVVKK